MIRGILLFALIMCLWGSTPVFAAGTQYAQGDSGPVVEEIQKALAEGGYYGGKIDGTFNAMTRQAVMAFQKAKKLKVDGIVDAKTFKLLTGAEIPGKSATKQPEALTGNAAKIIDTALSYRGVPYRFGGSTPKAFDCSGFVMYVFNQHGVKLPRTADKQFEVGKVVKNQSDLKLGDLVFFETYEKGASHVGIYKGGGQFIHASSSQGVTVTPLSNVYFSKRYYGARRVL